MITKKINLFFLLIATSVFSLRGQEIEFEWVKQIAGDHFYDLLD